MVALLIEASPGLRGFYRAAHFLPVMSTMSAMAIVWGSMLHPTIGLVNRALGVIGISGVNWLRDERTALLALAVIGIWQGFGFAMVLFVSGLKAVPQQLYDAAAIDGADGILDRLRLVTLPMLGPVTMFVVILTAKRSFEVFDSVRVLTQGGPNYASDVLLHRLYTESFDFLRMGYGAALTVVYLAIIVLLDADTGAASRTAGALFMIARVRYRRFVGRVARHAVLMLTAAFALLPFVWMVSLSLKPPEEIFQADFHLWPTAFHGVENYRVALTAAPMFRFLLNGLLVCAAIFALQLLVCIPCAYALAKLRFHGRDTLFSAVLVAPAAAAQALAIPHFVLLHVFGLLDTYAALILPWVISTFGIFLLRQFFRSIPDEIIHAARLDGLGEFEIIWRIMIPMTVPALAAFGIFSVVAHWNDLVLAAHRGAQRGDLDAGARHPALP